MTSVGDLFGQYRDANPRTYGSLSSRFMKTLAAEAWNPGEEGARGKVDLHWLEAGVVKSALGAIVTGDVGSGDLRAVQVDFLDTVYPLSALGRLPGLILQPFGRPTLVRTDDGGASWVAEGAAAPMIGMAFARSRALTRKRVTGMDVATRESFLNGPPKTDKFLLNSLAMNVAKALDIALFDPTNSGSSAAPTSITYGVTPVVATGDAEADVDALFASYAGSWMTAVVVMHPMTAVQLGQALMGTGSDTRLGVQGGVLCGVPVVTSEGVPLDSSGGLVALFDVAALAAAVEIDELSVSTQATIQMDTAPTMDSVTPTATQVVSLFQTNCIGLLAQAHADWVVRRSGSVAVLSGASYPVA